MIHRTSPAFFGTEQELRRRRFVRGRRMPATTTRGGAHGLRCRIDRSDTDTIPGNGRPITVVGGGQDVVYGCVRTGGCHDSDTSVVVVPGPSGCRRVSRLTGTRG